MAEKNQKMYDRYKWTTFISMYVGYILLVLNRKSFSFALPAIMNAGFLEKDDLGLITSSQSLAYGISKFFGGILSDSLDSKLMLSGGLFMAGFLTLTFTVFESAPVFAVLWFMQGLFQGGVWPACAKILKQWAHPDEFGTLWGVLSTGMNIAGSTGPLLATLILLRFSWRWHPRLVFGTWYAALNTTVNVACCLGPMVTAYVMSQDDCDWTTGSRYYGLAAMLVAGGCMLTITRSPQEIGLSNDGLKKSDSTGKSRGRGRGTWRDMLSSPFLAVLCTSYMIVFMGRTTALDWAQLYLIQDAQQSTYMGSVFITCFELGGIVGTVIAGYAADKLVAMSKREDTRGTPRMTVVIGFVTVALVSLHLLIFTVSQQTSQLYISALGALLGGGLCGPIALYGVMAIEAAPTHLSGTSHAIVALSANVGAVLAGLPFSYIAKYLEWRGAFICLELLLALVLVLKVFTRNVQYKMVPVRKKME